MPVAGIAWKARGSSDRWILIVAVAASSLLVTLAVLQYRWTGELSAAANERMRANLEESSRLLANDIDAPLAQLHASFQRTGRRTAAAGAWLAARDDPRRSRGGASEPFEDLLAQAVRDWRASAAFPDLLDETWIVVTDRRERTRDVSRLVEDGGRLQPDPEPDDVAELIRPLRQPGRRLPDVRPDRLVIPVSARMPGGRPGPPTTLIVASLDVAVLEQEMLPALIERHFGAVSPGGERPYLVSVTDVSGPAPRQVYPDPAGAQGRTSTTPSQAADIEFRALRMRPFPERPGGRDEGARRGRGTEPDLADGAWLVRITHRRGSLEAATDAARRRNLYVSSGALFLIGVAFALVLVSARRARTLAAQQVDFVAGVSHELNTPLQAIRSAAENLSTGIVHRSDDVRGYGEMIEREGRRLTRLVEQALQWAGIGRSSARNATADIDLGELLHTTVAESNWFLDDNGVELELDGLDDLPTVRGDRAALIRVFLNLLHNAAKYGRSADGTARIRVDASCDAGRRRVTVAVTDRGPGIPRAERRRIFDPFVRGRRPVGRTVGQGRQLRRRSARRQPAGQKRSSASSSAPTTTWPSRSRPWSCWPGSRRCFGAPRHSPPQQPATATDSATCGSTSTAPRSSGPARTAPRRRSAVPASNTACSSSSSSTGGRSTTGTACSTRSGATTRRRPPEPSTCTCHRCARRWRPTRASPSSSSRCTASVTASTADGVAAAIR